MLRGFFVLRGGLVLPDTAWFCVVLPDRGRGDIPTSGGLRLRQCCAKKKSSSVKITLLLKVDLEEFEPLTFRVRTERSPSNIAFVHTLCTVKEEKLTYIRLYKLS